MPYHFLPPFTISRVSLPSEGRDLVSWGQRFTGLPEPWRGNRGKSKDGRRVKIAICDTGFDRTHVERGDLRDAECFDFTGTGKYCLSDRDNHGSHCGGIAGGRADDKGVIGFCPDACLASFKCMVNGMGSSQWISSAVRAAADWGADVISCSFGSEYPDPAIAEAYRYANKKGSRIVSAAGNSGRPDGVNYPARWKRPNGDLFLDSLAIGAFQENGQVAPYSSRGPEVDFLGPGSNIPSCWASGGYASLSGTSMATPAVAGLLGLLIVRHWDAGGGATPIDTYDQIREHLRRAAKDIGKLGKDDESGWGLAMLPPPDKDFVETPPDRSCRCKLTRKLRTWLTRQFGGMGR